ncbi:hypothetical protein GGQ92_000868 [Gracilibacillus halotolerans]|uniref:Uncharacterized protein n=1 Tax=Gracilibacillus halotolerans TaxID=74386 RepID=A0A841RJP1_9BACI|nr:hypothetical protein [Gracilibacillus halotolerans]MBB6512087.1 hypothetical protein [Gracilibacillus halotolerans]
MRCGTKYFDVEIDAENINQIMTVPARSPAEARKLVRQKCGSDVQILTVREKNRR